MTRRRVKLIAGGVVLLFLALVVVVALVIRALPGVEALSTADVADITSEAETTWQYDWAGDNNPDFLDDSPHVTAIGAGEALLWPVFDYAAYGESQGTSLGWYPGYDAQYDDGYAAGLEYRKADDAYHNDTFPYTVPPAKAEDFFPEGAFDNYDDFLGFQDGFSDASLELGAGASKREKPVDPDYTPTLTLLNAITGEVSWSVDLAEVLDGVDHLSTISAYDIEGSTAIAVVVSSPNSGSAGYSLVTLDKADGHALSSTSAEGQIDVAAFDGDIIVSAADERGETSTIGRYAVDRLGKSARWDVEIDGTPFLYVDRGFVIAYGEETGAVFTGADGKKANWGDDITYSVFYQFAADQLIRGENNEDGSEYTIDGLDADGRSRWREPVTADVVTILDDSIFTMQTASNGLENLQRVNPVDGTDMWKETYEGRFDAVVGVQGNSVLLSSRGEIVILDLVSGVVRVTQKVGDMIDVFEGESLYYVPAGDELVAYSYAKKGAVWSMDLRDGESISTLAQHLVLLNHESSVMYGLAAR